MPLLWPALPNFVNDAERRVWTALNEQLGENDLLIANQAIAGLGTISRINTTPRFHTPVLRS